MKYLKKYNLIKEGIVEEQFKFGNMVMDLIIKENPIVYDVDDVMNEINDILKSFFTDELVVSDRFAKNGAVQALRKHLELSDDDIYSISISIYGDYVIYTYEDSEYLSLTYEDAYDYALADVENLLTKLDTITSQKVYTI